MQTTSTLASPLNRIPLLRFRIIFLLTTAVAALACTSATAQEKVKMTFNGTDSYTFDSTRIDVEQTGDNLFIGDQAGLNNMVSDTTGFSNVFLGTSAGVYNQQGATNTFVGTVAGFRNVSGNNNTYLGSGAGAGNTDGPLNAASNNTFIGNLAGFNILSGLDNTSVGLNTLLGLTTGAQNVALGSGALSGITTTSGNVAIGYQAGAQETGANKLYIANTNTTSPLLYGEFDNQLLRVNGTLQIGTHYAFPPNDGIIGQVLSTDGSGQLGWHFLADDDPFNEAIDSVKFNYPFLEVYQGGNPFPFQTDLFVLHDDADADPLNELQTLAVSGDSLYLSNGNGVKIPGGSGMAIIDDDSDTKVEAVNYFFDQDKIDFTVEGNNFLRLTGNRIGFHNTNNNIVISDTTVQSLGNHNTFIGSATGNAFTIGDGNTCLGSGAGASVFTGSGNVFLGRDAGKGVNADDKLYIDNSDTLAPLIYGEFDNNRLGVNGLLAVGHQTPSTTLHVKSVSTEVARFESTDNTIVRFYKSGTEKGLIQALFDDMLFGKTTGPAGSVQLYNQGHYLSLENDGDVAVGTSNPVTSTLHVQSNNADTAFSSIVGFSGSSDVVAVKGSSKPAEGYGIGGFFEGGFYGIQAEATGGTSFTRYGVSGKAIGGSTAYGIYGSASGASSANWAGYFVSGNVFVNNDLRIGDPNGYPGYQVSSDGAIAAEDQIDVYNSSGTLKISLDADYNGDGRIITDEIQINGGSDFAERFEVGCAGTGLMKPEPGMLVSIDPAQPGHLQVTTQPHDKKVAGVLSGANGIKPGVYMGQAETIADGTYPVALSGRVYVRATTENGPIQAGDMLTSSSLPGYAMKVTDHAQAYGSVIGKAMTSLASGEGYILLLVGLQ